jgi:seryl-tRNA synthetase
MLDITLLRRDLPQVIARLETRKSPQVFLNVEVFQTLENERKTLQTRTEELQSIRNTVSKQIGIRKSKGESADAEMAQVADIKTELEQSAARLDILQADLQTLLLAVPNLHLGAVGDLVRLAVYRDLLHFCKEHSTDVLLFIHYIQRVSTCLNGYSTYTWPCVRGP